jgi:hypothetical protein
MKMSLKARGILGIVLGVGCIALTVYGVHSTGEIYLFPCLLGPAILPISFVMSVVPVQKLYLPQEVDGRLEYDTTGTKHTPLGWALLGFGLVASGLFFLYLKFSL